MENHVRRHASPARVLEPPRPKRVADAGGRRLVFTYGTHGARTGINALFADLGQAGIRFRDLETRQSSLQDIFVGLVRDRR